MPVQGRRGVNARDAAIAAARRGWAVFPCLPGTKRPAVDRWEQRACADPTRVARHWPAGANAGIACGPSGLAVIDLDTHGQLPAEWAAEPGIKDGLDVYAALCQWAGQTRLPGTYWVTTPSGGWHFYFTRPEGTRICNSAGKLGPLIDVRAVGGYVIGAGSVVDGKRYEVLEDVPPAPLPGWITRALTRSDGPRPVPPSAADPGRRIGALARAVTEAPRREGNAVLHWAACRAAEMAAEGHDPAMLAEQLIAAACAGGRRSEAEARRTVTSGMRALR
jgi:hypothetical protein